MHVTLCQSEDLHEGLYIILGTPRNHPAKIFKGVNLGELVAHRALTRLDFTNRPVQHLLLKLVNRYARNIHAISFGNPNNMKLAISFEANNSFSNFLKLLNANQNLMEKLPPEQLKKILGRATIRNVSRHLAIKRLMAKSN
jgi:hypothetical protein